MNELDFLKVIETEPANPVPRLVYADWLDERGDPRGELLRIQEELRRIEVPDRAAKEARMHELLRDGIEPLMITRTNSIGMPKVLIFPGEFLMGTPEKEQDRFAHSNQVEVTLTRAFWLGKCPVTQAEWQQVMGNHPWRGQEDVQEDPACPATYVSWEDAIAFCRTLTDQDREAGRLPKAWEHTLPTEAQWEYACRAGTTTHFSFGDQETQLGTYAWFVGNSFEVGERYPHPVGQKQPNPWGLYDIHGNVLEWCRDGWQTKLPGGTNPESGHEGSCGVYRGGSWYDNSRGCQSAYRGGCEPSYRSYDLGFRVAQVLSKE